MKILSRHPFDMRMVLGGHEGGGDVAFADALAIRANANADADYYGPHLADPRQPSETAVWIGGARARGARPTVADMEADEARGIR